MKRVLILILIVFVACADESSEKYSLGFQAGLNKADSISRSSFMKEGKEQFEKGLREGMKRGLLQADSIANSLPKLNDKEKYNLGFQRAFYLNNNLIKKRLELTNDEFWRLVAEVYYTVSDNGRSSKPNSKYFESVSFLPQKQYRDIYRFRENLMKSFSMYRFSRPKYNKGFRNNFFVPADTIRIPNSNKFVVPMAGSGFENTPYVLSVFTFDNDKYYFNGILDSCFNVSIGSLKIMEIISLNNISNILIGQSRGGDAGDEWGSLWFVSLNNFFKLGKKTTFGYSYKLGENQTKFDYSVNKKTHTAYVNTYTRKVVSEENEKYEYAEWAITKKDTLNLN